MIKNIRIGGITIKNDASSVYSFRRITGLATPTYRTTSVIYSGRSGGQNPKQLYGQRVVAIEGGIDANLCEDHIDARQDFLDALSFDEPTTITFDLDDGRSVFMTAKFEQPDLPIDAGLFTDFQIIALSEDHRLFDATTGNINTVTVARRVNGGLRWLSGSGLRWYTGSGLRWASGAGLINAQNTGTTSASPVITIYGANQNPTITNTATGELIKINVTTSATDVIVINSGEFWSVKLNGGNINALADSTSSFFDLQPGDNLLEFTTDNAGTGYAVVEWYNAYLGV